MEIEVQVSPEHPTVAVVRLRGRIDMLAAPAVRERLRATIDGGRPDLVVDASGVSFIDSSGLSALVAALKQARQAGGNLHLATPTPQVRLVLQVTALDRVMRPYDSVEAATADLLRA